MRTENSTKNLIATLFGQGLGILISFFSRMMFLDTLGKEYLGINGLFTELLTMLSLVELGIGPAIIYSLYKPLAEKDDKKVHALMALYKKAYVTIGFFVAFLGLLLVPFLQYLIKELPDIPNIRLIFMLFVLNSSISYFFSYKRSLIIADQKRYIATIYRYGFYILLNILQMLVLYLTKNYLLYLILQIVFTLLENIAVSLQANRMYPFLKKKSSTRLGKADALQIIRNTKALVIHRIGGVTASSTDNVLLSIMIGTIWVGLYSNYQLIIGALHMVIMQVFESILASVGNLRVTGTAQQLLKTFNAVFLINFWICGFFTICFYILADPFITLWLGKDLLLPKEALLIITINFYIRGMRRATLTFRNAFGFYWHYRYYPICETVINIVASICLVKQFGISGVFYGALVSTLTTCFWIDPHVLYKHGFQKKSMAYFIKYIIYVSIVLLTGALTKMCCEFIPFDGISGLLLQALICLILPNLIFFLLFFKTREFRYLWDKASYIFLKLKNKLLNG